MSLSVGVVDTISVVVGDTVTRKDAGSVISVVGFIILLWTPSRMVTYACFCFAKVSIQATKSDLRMRFAFAWMLNAGKGCSIRSTLRRLVNSYTCRSVIFRIAAASLIVKISSDMISSFDSIVARLLYPSQFIGRA
jgi:hypothetical protein